MLLAIPMSNPAEEVLPPLESRPWGPWSASEIVTSAVSIYREKFALFFSVSLAAALLLYAMEIPALLFFFSLVQRVVGHPAQMSPRIFLPILPLGMLWWAGGIFIQCAVMGTIFRAVEKLKAGETLAIPEAIREGLEVSRRTFATGLLVMLRIAGWYLAIAAGFIVVIASFFGLAHVFGIKMSGGYAGGAVLGFFAVVFMLCFFFAYLILIAWLVSRYFVTIPCALNSQDGLNKSISNAVRMTKGRRARIYAVMAVAFIAMIMATVAATPVNLVMMAVLAQHADHWWTLMGPYQLAMQFVVGIAQAFLFYPFLGIGMSLCYFDLMARINPPEQRIAEAL